MKIVLCGSMTASKQMIIAKDDLQSLGHQVVFPEGTLRFAETGYQETSAEATANKAHGDLIKGYYEEIAKADAIVVVNVKKNETPGYIGGNVFLEIGFAHVLNKGVYVLYPLPKASPYLDELLAINPTILNQDFSKIK